MKQQYFILVLAHSLHGRLRRVHVPHTAIYAVLALALFGFISLFGLVSSYARMAWKVANYNNLRQEVSSLQKRYQELQRSSNQTKSQLAELQILASEVSVAYGIKQKLEGPNDISSEGRLVPTYRESFETYNLLKTADIFRSGRTVKPFWHVNLLPRLWPVQGAIVSPFGYRGDPFSGRQSFHSGVDITAGQGTPVKATADGVIAQANWSGDYGKLVVVDHSSGVSTYYGHLSRVTVVPGQEIRMGQVVGYSGATGRASGPHLHYEVRRGGTPVNPYTTLAQSMIVEKPVVKDLPFQSNGGF